MVGQVFAEVCSDGDGMELMMSSGDLRIGTSPRRNDGPLFRGSSSVLQIGNNSKDPKEYQPQIPRSF
jgi:hypothetical protein